ncbi:MAG: DUF4153 domain-containing protein [Lachnospiraceae bacterium]|nr:DUF4153 domain-containing protein [Lachnospiraceae bacterium]
MGKIKNLLDEQKNELKDIFVKYIVTIISVFVLCILVIIWDEAGGDFSDAFEQFITFMGIFVCGTFFIETVIKKNKVVMYFIDAFVSLVWTILGYNLHDWIGERASDNFYKFFVLYIMLILGISFYRIIRRSGLSFQKYVTKVIINFVKWGLIFLVIDIGIAVILGIFDSLIFDIDYFDVFFHLQLLMAGLIYFPYALICIMAEEAEKTKFFKVLMKFIAMPILLIAMAIIYLYILKIIFTQNVPKNEVFYICAGVFSLGFVVNTMAYAYIDGVDSSVSYENTLSVYDKIIKYLKYGFIPMVLLEIYSIGVRIAQYGVTDSRYMAVVFIIAQIIYLAWEPINKLISGVGRGKKDAADAGYGKGYEKFIFVAIIIYVIVVMLPVVNFEFVCYNSQKARFEEAMDAGDYKAAKGAYRELEYNYYGKKFIDKNYSKEEIEELNAQYYESTDRDDSSYYYGKYISYNYDNSNINISGYSRMCAFNVSNYYKLDMYNTDTDIAPENFSYNWINSIELKDISGVVQDAIANNEDKNIANYSKLPYEYLYDSNIKIVITRIKFEYYEDGKTIENLSLEGYILMK